MSFYRFENEAPEDSYVNIIAMIATKIEIKKISSDVIIYSFLVVQQEEEYLRRINYRCDSKDKELNLFKLHKAVGTIVFMNNCSENNGAFDLEYDEDLIVLALRPNNFQVEKFLKEFII